MEDKIQALRQWVRDTLPEGCGAVIPISGGTDSALAFWLYTTTFPERTIAVFFGDALRERAWFESIGEVRFLPHPESAGNAEVARWAEVLDIALPENRVVIGTRNKTEQVLGTYSNASRIAMHQPLAGLWKSTVLELCGHIGVPEAVIASSREADPVCGRPEELARIPFDAVDAFAKAKLGSGALPDSLDAAQLAYLDGLFAYNNFKGELPLSGPALP